jgi:hypothetical protein
MSAVLVLVAVAAAADGYLTSQVGERVRARHEASARTIVVVVDSANDVGTFQRPESSSLALRHSTRTANR